MRHQEIIEELIAALVKARNEVTNKYPSMDSEELEIVIAVAIHNLANAS